MKYFKRWESILGGYMWCWCLFPALNPDIHQGIESAVLVSKDGILPNSVMGRHLQSVTEIKITRWDI